MGPVLGRDAKVLLVFLDGRTAHHHQNHASLTLSFVPLPSYKFLFPPRQARCSPSSCSAGMWMLASATRGAQTSAPMTFCSYTVSRRCAAAWANPDPFPRLRSIPSLPPHLRAPSGVQTLVSELYSLLPPTDDTYSTMIVEDDSGAALAEDVEEAEEGSGTSGSSFQPPARCQPGGGCWCWQPTLPHGPCAGGA